MELNKLKQSPHSLAVRCTLLQPKMAKLNDQTFVSSNDRKLTLIRISRKQEHKLLQSLGFSDKGYFTRNSCKRDNYKNDK